MKDYTAEEKKELITKWIKEIADAPAGAEREAAFDWLVQLQIDVERIKKQTVYDWLKEQGEEYTPFLREALRNGTLDVLVTAAARGYKIPLTSMPLYVSE